MKKLAILSIVAILILSGCVDNADNKDSTKSSTLNSTADANIDVKSDVATVGTGTEQKIDVSDVGGDVTNGETGGDNVDDTNVNTGSDWCTPGDKITVDIQGNQEEFSVIGITTYTDKKGNAHENVCKAEKTIQGGTSVRYFNEEGSFVAMVSKSSGVNANSNAEAIATVPNNQ